MLLKLIKSQSCNSSNASDAYLLFFHFPYSRVSGLFFCLPLPSESTFLLSSLIYYIVGKITVVCCDLAFLCQYQIQNYLECFFWYFIKVPLCYKSQNMIRMEAKEQQQFYTAFVFTTIMWSGMLINACACRKDFFSKSALVLLF